MKGEDEKLEWLDQIGGGGRGEEWTFPYTKNGMKFLNKKIVPLKGLGEKKKKPNQTAITLIL